MKNICAWNNCYETAEYKADDDEELETVIYTACTIRTDKLLF